MEPPLLDTLVASRAFKHHRFQWVLFYAGSAATLISFIILCTISAWTLSVAREISAIVSTAGETLRDVETMLPILKDICRHSNFTRIYGDVCP